MLNFDVRDGISQLWKPRGRDIDTLCNLSTAILVGRNTGQKQVVLSSFSAAVACSSDQILGKEQARLSKHLLLSY